MFEQEALALLRSKVAFMANYDGSRPRVRPMKPFVDEANRIWLFSHLETKKVGELSADNRVDLCIVGEMQEILRVSGKVEEVSDATRDLFAVTRSKLFAALPGVGRYYSGPDDPKFVLFRLRAEEISFASRDCEMTGRVELGPASQA